MDELKKNRTAWKLPWNEILRTKIAVNSAWVSEKKNRTVLKLPWIPRWAIKFHAPTQVGRINSTCLLRLAEWIPRKYTQVRGINSTCENCREFHMGEWKRNRTVRKLPRNKILRANVENCREIKFYVTRLNVENFTAKCMIRKLPWKCLGWSGFELYYK